MNIKFASGNKVESDELEPFVHIIMKKLGCSGMFVGDFSRLSEYVEFVDKTKDLKLHQQQLGEISRGLGVTVTANDTVLSIAERLYELKYHKKAPP